MKHSPRKLNPRFLLPVLGSALLQVAAFPNFNQPWAAYIALVPWLLLLPKLTAKEAFWCSHLVGFVFFLGSVWWLVHVTVAGWLILCFYLALFFGLFGLLARRFQQAKPIFILIGVPAVWVALEHARTHLLSGFGWNLLAYSQAPWPAAIQLAQATGSWGVSFFIVLFNVGAARAFQEKKKRMIVLPALIVAAVFIFGSNRLRTPQAPGVFKIAVVQGNIPQEKKWDEAYEEEILSRYEKLTRQAASDWPRLIIWPETAAPGYVGVDEELTQRLFTLSSELQVPLLIGSPVPKLNDGSFDFFNRAALISGGEIIQTYDKLHLVPYGEFIPGERQLPWLRKVLPPIGDFMPGQEHTIFNIDDPLTDRRLRLAALICFEDVFPELARDFVRRGAEALVVITNDAWFGPTAAAYQHAQASAFRAVELGVPVIRAANTGWSGLIDPWGRWQHSVKADSGRELFVEGFSVFGIAPGARQTLYTQWGDWFARGCLLITFISLLPGIINGSNFKE